MGNKVRTKDENKSKKEREHQRENSTKVIELPLWLWRAIITGGTSSGVTVALHFLLNR